MSLLIENTEELLTVIKKLNLKVESVDELRRLMAEINANYNPEAERQKTGKLIGVTVPRNLAIAAAFASFCLFQAGQGLSPYHVGGVALIWGATALVSVASVIAAAIMTSIRHGNRAAPDRRNVAGEALVTGITKELP